MSVKTSKSVESFKTNLKIFKLKNFNKEGNYREFSEEIVSRINEDNRQSHVDYMIAHPRIAKALGTNIH